MAIIVNSEVTFERYGVKGCPFCNDIYLELKSSTSGSDTQYWYISCKNVNCVFGRTRAFRDKAKLIRLWNERKLMEFTCLYKKHDETCDEFEKQPPTFWQWLKGFVTGAKSE